ncbi:MAG: hypothetical protein ACJ75B_00795 [Flavisolibacter sp.]
MIGSDIEIFEGSMLVFKKSYSIEFIKETLKRKSLKGLRIFSLLQDELLGSIDFLKEFDFLEELDVTTREVYDFSCLKYLNGLKALSLNVPEKTRINLTSQVNLLSLTYNWNKNITGVENCGRLKELWVIEAKTSDFSFLSSLSKLENLTIKTASITNLNGLGSLNNLVVLIIQNCNRLRGVSNVNNLVRLRELQFDTCPNVYDFSLLSNLPHLEYLKITNCKKIKSVKFIEDLPSIRKLSLLGNTDVEDGNLLPLIGIKEIYYVRRDHYNIELETKKQDEIRNRNLEFLKRMIKKKKG